MAINYTEVGWDTSKYVNPTNMNQMDDGIKAACDGVDDLDTTKLDIAGGTMTGALTVNQGANAYSSITIGSSSMAEPNSSVLNMWRNGKYASIMPTTLTANRSYTLPNKSGTLALENDLIFIPLISVSATQFPAFQEWLKQICTNYPNKSYATFIGALSSNSGVLKVSTMIYNTSDVDSNGLPRYSWGEIQVGLSKYLTQTYDYVFSYKTISTT